MTKYLVAGSNVEKGILSVIIISTTNELMITFHNQEFTDKFVQDLPVKYIRRSENKITIPLG